MLTAYYYCLPIPSDGYDLDGNALRTTRRVLRPEILLAGLPKPGSGQWANTAYAVDWQTTGAETVTSHAEPLLDPTEYTTDATFDALGRRTSSTAPLT